MIAIILIITMLSLTGFTLNIVLHENILFKEGDIFEKITYNSLLGIWYIYISSTFLSIFLSNYNNILFTSYLTLLISMFLLRRKKVEQILTNSMIKVKNGFIADPHTIIMFLIIIITLYYSGNLVSNIIGSTSDDAAFHSLLIRLIIDNPLIIIDGVTNPYASFYLSYPILPHVICASLVNVLQISIHKIVTTFCAVFPVLLVISFYSTIKTIFKIRTLALLTAFLAFYTMKDMWIPIGWGGLPTLFSLFYSIANIGFINKIINEDHPVLLKLSLIITSISISMHIYPVTLLFTLFWISIEIGHLILDKKISIKNAYQFYSNNKHTIIFFSLFIIVFNSFYFLKIYNVLFNIINSNYPYDVILPSKEDNNIKIVKDALTVTLPNAFNDVSSIFKYNFSSISSIFPNIVPLIIVNFLIIKDYEKTEKERLNQYLISIIKLSMLFVIPYIYLQMFGDLNLGAFSINNIIPIIRTFRHISISAVIIPSLCIYEFFKVTSILLNINNKHIKLQIFEKTYIILCLLLIVGYFASGNIIYNQNTEFNNRIQVTSDYLSKYKILEKDDVSLIEWSKANLPKDSLVLVSAGDSGQYFTSISKIDSVYEFSLQIHSERYQKIMTLINEDPDSSELTELLKNYKITHVFIGSKRVNYERENDYRNRIDPAILKLSDSFIQINNVGNTYVFQFKP